MLIEILNAARSAGEGVRIIYHGGSHPGSQREIIPVVIIGDDVRAIDVASGKEKVFKIFKMELADKDCDSPAYDPAKPKELAPDQPIDELADPAMEELQAMGWLVVAKPESVSLKLQHPNGRPGKAVVRLVRAKHATTRPYIVEINRNSSGRCYGKLSSAWDKFMECAKLHAPKK